jgi:hypothetical protein
VLFRDSDAADKHNQAHQLEIHLEKFLTSMDPYFQLHTTILGNIGKLEHFTTDSIVRGNNTLTNNNEDSLSILQNIAKVL